MALGLNAMLPCKTVAQCTYTVTASGTLSTASFSTSGTQCNSSRPVSGSDATIVIPSGYTLDLTTSYEVGRDGLINIQSGGKLKVDAPLTVEANGAITVGAPNSVFSTMADAAMLTIDGSGTLDVSSRARVTVNGEGRITGDFNLGLGDGSASQQFTTLEINGTGNVQSGVLSVNKASIYIGPNATLSTNCNLVLYNSNILDAGTVTINGNLDLTPGGANNVLCGTGNVSVAGCVFGGKGAFNHINNNCTGAIGICSSGLPSAGCAGPVAGSNANERACDDLIPGCRPLPVELTAFTATPTARQQVALHWETASEKNSQSFVVERSADGKTFRDQRTVEAAGTSQVRTLYNVLDDKPLPGTSYYRLRQVDFDRSTSYSPVRFVSLNSKPEQALDVYPGPSGKEWVVSSALPAELLGSPDAALQVYDALGRVQPVTLTPGREAGRWNLGMQSLPPGLYVVRLLTGKGSYSRRIVQ